MPALIIPDIHDDFARAERIIASHAGRYDRIVFLGDYFDSQGDRPVEARRTAEWLMRSLADPGRTHLLGNHELAYLIPGAFTHCSGTTPGKMRAIRSIFADVPIGAFRPAVVIDGWLISHAGFHRGFVGADSPSGLVARAEEALRRVIAGHADPLFGCGRSRGGEARVGGITWCDFDWEFQSTPHLAQIVGHTRCPDEPRVRVCEVGGGGVERRYTRISGDPDGDRITRSDGAGTSICLDCDLEVSALLDGENVDLLWDAS